MVADVKNAPQMIDDLQARVVPIATSPCCRSQIIGTDLFRRAGWCGAPAAAGFVVLRRQVDLLCCVAAGSAELDAAGCVPCGVTCAVSSAPALSYACTVPQAFYIKKQKHSSILIKFGGVSSI